MKNIFLNNKFLYYLYTLFIIGVIVLAVILFWWSYNGYRTSMYPEGTVLGSIYLGGTVKIEVEDKVDSAILDWELEDTKVYQISYQGYSYQIDTSDIKFDTISSIDNIDEGEIVQLHAYYEQADREALQTEIWTLDFLDNVNNNIDYDALINDILNDASYLYTYSNLNISDYLLRVQLANVTINQRSLEAPNELFASELYSSLTENEMTTVTLSAEELFSLTDTFGKNTYSDDELSYIAMGIQAVILRSNFIIYESHYNNEINKLLYNDNADFPYFGINVEILTSAIDYDYVLYNPNETDYHIVMTLNGDEILFELVGLNFVDEIQISGINESKTLLPFNTKIVQNENEVIEGRDGVIVEIIRTITNAYGEVVENRIVVLEYYPQITEYQLELSGN